MAPDKEEKARLALEQWEADRPALSTPWDVLATGDTRLIAA